MLQKGLYVTYNLQVVLLYRMLEKYGNNLVPIE